MRLYLVLLAHVIASVIYSDILITSEIKNTFESTWDRDRILAHILSRVWICGFKTLYKVSMISHDFIYSMYETGTRDNSWRMILIETINILPFGLPWNFFWSVNQELATWLEGRYQKLALVNILKYLRNILCSTLSHATFYLLTKFHCLSLFLEMWSYIYIAIVCFPGCDVKILKLTLKHSFFMKPFSHMTKKVRIKI